MDRRGIKPRPSRCKRDVLSLSLTAQFGTRYKIWTCDQRLIKPLLYHWANLVLTFNLLNTLLSFWSLPGNSIAMCSINCTGLPCAAYFTFVVTANDFIQDSAHLSMFNVSSGFSLPISRTTKQKTLGFSLWSCVVLDISLLAQLSCSPRTLTVPSGVRSLVIFIAANAHTDQ